MQATGKAAYRYGANSRENAFIDAILSQGINGSDAAGVDEFEAEEVEEESEPNVD